VTARERKMAVAAVVGAVLVTLVGFEILLQVYAGDLRPGRVISKSLRAGDARLRFRNRANVDVTVENREVGKVRYRTDSRGLRDEEIPFEKPAGERRLLAVGDSFTYGIWVNEPETYVAGIERGLPGWEVVNTGVIDWAPDQEYLYLTTEGLRYEPDVVMLFFFVGNDFFPHADHSRLFTFENGTLTERPGDKTRSHHRSAFQRHVLDNIETRWFLRGRWQRMQATLLRKHYPAHPYLTWYHRDYPDETTQAGFDLTVTFIREMHRASEAAGARFLLATILSMGTNEYVWDLATDHPAVNPDEHDPRHPERVLDAFAAAEGIEIVHLGEAQRRYPDENHFLMTDGHYNPIGHARAAEVALDKLRTLGWTAATAEARASSTR